MASLLAHLDTEPLDGEPHLLVRFVRHCNWLGQLAKISEDDEDELHQTPNKDSRKCVAKINKTMWLYQDMWWIWCLLRNIGEVNSTLRHFKALGMDAIWCNLFRNYLQYFAMHHGSFRIISTGHWPPLVVPMLENGRFVCRAWTMSRHKAHKAASRVQLSYWIWLQDTEIPAEYDKSMRSLPCPVLTCAHHRQFPRHRYSFVMLKQRLADWIAQTKPPQTLISAALHTDAGTDGQHALAERHRRHLRHRHRIPPMWSEAKKPARSRDTGDRNETKSI